MSPEPVTIAYIMSRFPKLTETFVLYEMLELRRMGFRVVVLPLRLEKENISHPEVQEMQGDILPASLISLRTLLINLKWWLLHPVRCVCTFARAVAGTAGGHRKYVAASIAYFPKAVVFADRVQRLGIAHVHAHFVNHPALVAWMMHQLCGVSYSFTAHGTDLHVDQHMLSEKTKDAAFAVTISDYNVGFVAETAGKATAEKFEVIRCGTDLDLFHPAEPQKPSGERLEILCIASFRACKGHWVLFDACVELRKRGIPFRCRLVGYGAREEEIRQQIKDRNLTEEVVVEGPRSRPEVLRMLGETDVVALTSIQTPRGSREGIPVCLMEAMACGLPVVASRISGIPELVEDGVSGLLFTPRDSVAAADALARLFADPQLRIRMGQSARKRIAASYDLSKNARVLAERIRSEIRSVEEF